MAESAKLLLSAMRARPAPAKSNGNYIGTLRRNVSVLSTRGRRGDHRTDYTKL